MTGHLWLAAYPLHPVLGLRRSHGLPLHVAGGIGSAAGQRIYVVDHVARARTRSATGRWAGFGPLERIPGPDAAPNRWFSGLGYFRGARRRRPCKSVRAGQEERKRKDRGQQNSHFVILLLVPDVQRVGVVRPAVWSRSSLAFCRTPRLPHSTHVVSPGYRRALGL